MIIIPLAWIYITFLCWTWGSVFKDIVSKLTVAEPDESPFSFVCLIGLSAITVIAGLLSLFIPLGDWWVQLIFLLPAFYLLIKSRPSFLRSFKNQFSKLHLSSIIFLLSCLLMVLVMSTWTVVHPDTLGYHAQTIQWIEKYKAVPGLVHLNVRFGYQGLWFVDQALFGFSFTGTNGITFLNSTVILWFLLFMINRIDHNLFKEGRRLIGLCFTFLLLLTIWSYTQVRLTATSASPDFIAALFVLAIIYLLLEKDIQSVSVSRWLLVSFISMVAVTIKLSVAPILLVALTTFLLLVKTRKIKLALMLLIISILTLIPFIARNVITSGYIVFPQTTIDIANVDWKFSKEQTANEKNYITAYAKKQGVITKEDIEKVNEMTITEWLPTWWQNRSAADKTIIGLLALSILMSLLLLKRIFQAGFTSKLILITLLSGIVFWFINAPDPRFGFGQIIGFISVIGYLLIKKKEILISKYISILILMIGSLALMTYTCYRFLNFFEKDQWLKPMGIEKTAFTSFDCNGIEMHVPSDNKDFGIIPVPCTDLNCDYFSPRGNKITDGFKAKQNP